VGVKGHIPQLLGTWVDEYNELGEVRESRKKSKGEKFLWAVTIALDSQCFCMRSKKREEKRAWS
jgi:hypothetical protein